MKVTCSRCGAEYTIQEYEKDRFCPSCGALLKLEASVSREELYKGTHDDHFTYDVELATSIGVILHDQFRNKKGYFVDHVMPEYILPPIDEGSRELALYYTYVIAVDYQTDAHKLWRNARGLYLQNPEYFKPENIINIPDEELRTFVRGLGARFPSNGAKAWKDISRILIRHYDGDPRNITREPLTSREVWRTCARAGALVPLRAMEDCVHNPPIKPAIERVRRQAASRVRCAPWQLDMPIWVIASNQCTNKWCNPCPVKELCKQNFDAKIKGNNLKYRP